MNLMLWVLGSAIGSRFQGMTRRLLGRYLWQSGVATLLALVVLAVFAELIHQTVGVGRDVASLALALAVLVKWRYSPSRSTLTQCLWLFITCCGWSP